MDNIFWLIVAFSLSCGRSGALILITNPKNGSGIAVPENSKQGSLVETLTAQTDGPDKLFIIAQQTVPGCFVISDPTSGVITVNNSADLDYESLSTHYLTFVVSAGIDYTPGTLVVNIEDKNDNSPYFQPVLDKVHIPDKSGAGTHLIRANASDRDGSAPNNQIAGYKITVGNVNDTFSINQYGDIRVADGKLVDRVLIPRYSLIVIATDGGTPQLTGSVLIRVYVGENPWNSAMTLHPLRLSIGALLCVLYFMAQ